MTILNGIEIDDITYNINEINQQPKIMIQSNKNSML